jgi:hypothetical protein
VPTRAHHHRATNLKVVGSLRDPGMIAVVHQKSTCTVPFCNISQFQLAKEYRRGTVLYMRILDKLLEPAATQHGYVTTQDAVNLGVHTVELRKLARRGHLTNVGHGLYRVAAYPHGARDEFMKAALWPAGRGVISHQAALALWDLADVNPARIDVSVPNPYRPRRRGGDRYRIWTVDIDPGDVDYVDGVPVMVPRRAIIEAARAGLPRRFVEQAIQNARRRGLIGRETEGDIRAAVGGGSQ